MDYIAPTLDTSTGTLFARALFANVDHALLPGMFVRIRVPVAAQAGEALLVPSGAIGADQGGRYLLVVDKENKVEQRAVTTGAEYGNLRVIETGIGPDDRVIVAGLQRAVPGETVAPRHGRHRRRQVTPAP